MQLPQGYIHLHELSPREIKVAKLVKAGHSNKTIAEILCLKEKAVKWHLTNIYKKLLIKNRIDLITKRDIE